jgi:hypothetical protein
MEPELDPDVRGRRVIQFIEPRLSDAQRLILLEWAERLLDIRGSDISTLEKARGAIRETYRREVVLALLTTSASSLKDLAWDDRSWSARLGIGAATVTAAAVGRQGAGIAALGSAVGVPLWIVFGAGGSFAGMLIDELSRVMPQRPVRAAVGDQTEAIDAEWTLLDPGLEADLLNDLRDGSFLPLLQAGESMTDGGREPLWSVFRSAYRGARTRQRQGKGPHRDSGPGTPPDQPT